MNPHRQPYLHKVYEITHDSVGRLQIVRTLESIRGKKRFRELCMKNYWHSRKPLRLAFQLEGNPREPFYEVIPHASTGRPSICFAVFTPAHEEVAASCGEIPC